MHKNIMLDCTGEVQTSGPQGSLGYCFSGLLIRTKMYLQLEEEFFSCVMHRLAKQGKLSIAVLKISDNSAGISLPLERKLDSL